jgi:threonine dehydrogenase-like Zn-dependent dehydrogenase
MRALTLYQPEKMEIREIPAPAAGPDQVLVKVGGVGLCGTDFHIYQGHANYNFDESGRQIPLEKHPQVLGHEFCGRVEEVGANVRDLAPGDRVVVDQGLNCLSRGIIDRCEYCLTGDSHQCQYYKEHGITGLQGALAEYIAVPAVNAVKIESDLSMAEAAMAEPLGCVTHACEKLIHTAARYRFGGERPIKNVLVCGAGPAGLLFTQYLRNVLGFEGVLIVSEPSESRRRIAEGFGATTIDPTRTDLVAAVDELTAGERLHCLIESAGVASLFKQIPGVLRKQGSIVLYGHGHHGVDLGVINTIQFIEPTLVAPTGASGGFDADGRPLTYRRSLALLSEKKIDVAKLITHRYSSLEAAPQGFAKDRFENNYIKGVAVL